MEELQDTPVVPQDVPRRILANSLGYREVSPEYRVWRSLKLESITPTGRIRCPMVDAAHSSRAYRLRTLEQPTGKGIQRWAEGIGFEKVSDLSGIAYLSGPVRSILGNFIRKHFDPDAIDTGLIIWLKGGVCTGVLKQKTFDQASFTALVLAVHPQLEGQAMTESWLYSGAADDLYIKHSDSDTVLRHNMKNFSAGFIRKKIGRFISGFEMKKLLFGFLSQPLASAAKADSLENADLENNGILLRDLYDFYRYGWYPAHIEERLQQAGVISFS